MSIVLDIIICIIVLFNIIYGWKQGFVKIVLRSLTFVIALAAAFLLVNPLCDKVMDTEYGKLAEEKIFQSVTQVLDNLDKKEDNSQVVYDMPAFVSVLEYVGVDTQEIQADLSQWIETKEDALKTAVVQKAAPLLYASMVKMCTFAAIFISVYIVASIAFLILDKAMELPVLKQANALLGVAVGIVTALCETYIFTYLVQAILPYNEFFGGILTGINPDSTFLFKLFSEYNIFRMIF